MFYAIKQNIQAFARYSSLILTKSPPFLCGDFFIFYSTGTKELK